MRDSPSLADTTFTLAQNSANSCMQTSLQLHLQVRLILQTEAPLESPVPQSQALSSIVKVHVQTSTNSGGQAVKRNPRGRPVYEDLMCETTFVKDTYTSPFGYLCSNLTFVTRCFSVHRGLRSWLASIVIILAKAGRLCYFIC